MNVGAACFVIHTWLMVTLVASDDNTSTTAGGNIDDNDNI
jgi:hypothetical protein